MNIIIHNNMKKNLFTAIATLTAVFGMTACSSSDDLNGGDNQGNSGQSQYITVSLVTNQAGSQVLGAKAAHTRADNVTNNGTYHSGTENEGKVNKVRFFFFDASGQPVAVNGNLNYIDHDFSSEKPGNGDDNTTTERRYATLVLDPVRGNVPSQVDVVVNYDSLKATTTNGQSPLAQLTGTNLDYASTGASTIQTATFNNTSSKDNFVMSSSKYTDASGAIHFSVSTVGHIHNSQTDANKDPIDIYVERLAAKVVAQKGNTSSNKWIRIVENASNHQWTETTDASATGVKDAYVLYDGTGENDPSFETSTTDHKYKVIALINGWGLADEMPNGYIFKNIQSPNSNSYWNTDSNLGFQFSTYDFHRSFWETIPNKTNVTLRNHTWNDYTRNTVTNFSAPTLNSDNSSDAATALYTMPNTPTAPVTFSAANNSTSRTDLTKLLVAATLLYQPEGTSYYVPATICQLGGVYYLGTDNLINQILASNPILVGKYNTQTKSVSAWYSLGTSDITVNNPTDGSNDNKQFTETFSYAGGKAGQSLSDNEQWVYAQGRILSGETTPSDFVQWYTTSNDGSLTNNGLTSAQEMINRNSNTAMIWREGRTYYYTTIRHYAPSEANLGYFGVVRNHEYRMSVQSFAGFGTPVYDPSYLIVPVKPSTSNTYLSAAINVLQWRVVNNNVDFDSNVNTSSSSTAKRR